MRKIENFRGYLCSPKIINKNRSYTENYVSEKKNCIEDISYFSREDSKTKAVTLLWSTLSRWLVHEFISNSVSRASIKYFFLISLDIQDKRIQKIKISNRQKESCSTS